MDRFLNEAAPARPAERLMAPPIDVVESEEHYKVSIELPGVTKDDISIEVHEEVLSVRGEKRSQEEDSKGRYLERSFGSFNRSFRLPADADADHVNAAFADGVLTIEIGKRAEAKPRTVAIH